MIHIKHTACWFFFLKPTGEEVKEIQVLNTKETDIGNT